MELSDEWIMNECATLVYAIIVHAVIDWLDVKIRQWDREAETARMRSAQSPPPSA